MSARSANKCFFPPTGEPGHCGGGLGWSVLGRKYYRLAGPDHRVCTEWVRGRVGLLPGQTGKEPNALTHPLRFLAGQLQVTPTLTPNGSGLSQEFEGHWPEIPERSPCVAGVLPVIYYSVLLGLGLPGEWGAGSGVLGLPRSWSSPSMGANPLG